MNNLNRYIIGGIILIPVIFLCRYFSSIIAYILIAVVISFLGRPISNLLERIKIKGHTMTDSIRAAITLFSLWAIFIMFFYAFIPLVTKEFQVLNNICVESVLEDLAAPLQSLENGMKRFGFIEPDDKITTVMANTIQGLVKKSKVQEIFGAVAGTITNIAIALFSITFISFFFIKENKLFLRILLAVVPTKYESGVRNALESIQHLLMRYFVGIFCEMLIIMALNVIGLTIIGISFGQAVLIGLITGVTNVIPYLGPLIGAVTGLSIGVVTHIEMDFYTMILPMLLYMSIVFIITQLIDNVVLQPIIYGTSVYAHPLEIFLVILMAGKIAGIPGMILAIPGYTVLRVILLEFFNKYRLVKKITQGLAPQESDP